MNRFQKKIKSKLNTLHNFHWIPSLSNWRLTICSCQMCLFLLLITLLTSLMIWVFSMQFLLQYFPFNKILHLSTLTSLHFNDNDTSICFGWTLYFRIFGNNEDIPDIINKTKVRYPRFGFDIPTVWLSELFFDLLKCCFFDVSKFGWWWNGWWNCVPYFVLQLNDLYLFYRHYVRRLKWIFLLHFALQIWNSSW